MKYRKLLLVSSVCAAMASTGNVANAAIAAVPGEALLVPLMLTDGGDIQPGSIETYVALQVPTTLGTDTVINDYIDIHTSAEGVVTDNTPSVPLIHWTVYNERSVPLEDGVCEVSAGDMTIWSTNPAVAGSGAQSVQARQRVGLQDIGWNGPSPLCGPTVRPRFGYVVFETFEGSDGNVADFAFAGQAGATIVPFYNMAISIPVMPMADGADSEGELPTYLNSVIVPPSFNTGNAKDPIEVAPIAAGIRMNDSDAINEDVITQMPIPGPADPVQPWAMAMHVSWFDRNGPTATHSRVWDDMENSCSDPYDLMNELNIWVYNQQTLPIPGLPAAANWAYAFSGANVGPNVVPAGRGGGRTDLIAVVGGGLFGVPRGGSYCAPAYWLPDAVIGTYPGALGGYVEYRFDEFNNPAPVPGLVNSAAVQFAVVEGAGGFWTTHMATDLGKQ